MQWFNFYPRPPRGGRLRAHCCTCLLLRYFYPRPPRGGRLAASAFRISFTKHFYPRPPRGGRQYLYRSYHALGDFYPRPPRGGRRTPAQRAAKLVQFLSTPSARRATFTIEDALFGKIKFLSTPSARRATEAQTAARKARKISIHALREEGDGGAMERRRSV